MMTSTTTCKEDTEVRRPRRVTIDRDISPDQLRSEARRSHPSKAKKFLALAAILDGKSYLTVAQQAEVAVSSIYYWIHSFNRMGFNAFQRNTQCGRRCRLHSGNEALARKLVDQASTARAKDARKLRAIAKVLLNIPGVDIARDAQISRSTLSKWVQKFSAGGTSELLGLHRRDGRRVKLRNDITLQHIHAAATHVKKRSARRFRAIALIMEGRTIIEAAQELEVSISSVVGWCGDFNREGLSGLTDKSERTERRQNSFSKLANS